VLDFTKGGLVVYGSLIGAVAATLVFLHRRKLPKLAFADLVAPSMLIGLALGRIGCLLNGCCYGGVCPVDSLGLEFPAPSPPYVAQLHEGLLLGLELDDKNRVNNNVNPDSLAGLAGIKKGDPIQLIEVGENRVLLKLGEPGKKVIRQVSWQGDQLPDRSLPVYPSQLLSSVNALLLCFFLCTIYPYRKRDGQVFALMLILYAISRFLLEIIRSDEPHVYFSLFTPAQTVSLVIFTTGAVALIATFFFPAPLALPVDESCVNHSDKKT
jgi:phosphatidylglycerol:prolipoprotein diacylglycerol transferase